MSREHRRLAHALLLSLLIHTWLLSLTFGDRWSWLPGFGFPWRERRIEATDLSVILVPAQVTAAEPVGTSAQGPMQASMGQPEAVEPVLTPSASPAPTSGRTAEAIVPKAKRAPRPKPTAKAVPEPDAATGVSPANAPLRAEESGDAATTPVSEQAVIAVERFDEATLVVPAAPSGPASAIASAPSTANPETAMPSPRDTGDAPRARIDQEERERVVEVAKVDPSRQEEQTQAAKLAAAQDAARQEAARAENARLEAERQEAARKAAKVREAAQKDAARTEAARAENARLEAERQEAARKAADVQEAARQLAGRQEAARIEAARAEAARAESARAETTRAEAARAEAARAESARAESARAEAARAESARAEAARAEAARAEAARADAARAEALRAEAARAEAARADAARAEAAQAEARREATLRAIGRQLDEEAARRDAATAATRPLPGSSGARRYWLLARTDPNPELILYAEAWSRKIQLNATTYDMVRDVAKEPHTDPLVTVAIRSDGSVESITFVVSSGVPAIDEAIRRVVESQKPYQAFPPALARDWDVIHIRRSWYFDTAIRLQ